MAEQVFHRCYLLAVAGNDQIEEAEIGIYVERETMSGDPTRYVHADSRNFPARVCTPVNPFESKRFDLKIRTVRSTLLPDRERTGAHLRDPD